MTRGSTYGKEPRRIGEPRLDKSGCVEDDVATEAGVDERAAVGHIAVDQLDSSLRRETGDVAGAPDQGSNRVALLQKRVAESPP